ncbi:MAG: hypothetical protein ACOYIG_12845 [Acetivibrionales bacterium]|jgi:hypothetical protein
MAFPSSPQNGDKYIKNNADIYTYNSTTNAWTLSGHVSMAGSCYIADSTFVQDIGNQSSGWSGSELGTTYCVNVGNYIFSPSLLWGGGQNQLMMLYFTTDSTAFPVKSRASYSSVFGGSPIISQYLNNGIIYFNDNNNKYHTFNTSTFAFTTNNSGSYTTGTLINSPLQLNGYQYEPVGYIAALYGEIFADVKTKVTKL